MGSNVSLLAAGYPRSGQLMVAAAQEIHAILDDRLALRGQGLDASDQMAGIASDYGVAAADLSGSLQNETIPRTLTRRQRLASRFNSLAMRPSDIPLTPVGAERAGDGSQDSFVILG
jgi:hypothetical protein